MALIDSHGRHHDECDVIRQVLQQTRCDCGFSKVIKELEKNK